MTEAGWVDKPCTHHTPFSADNPVPLGYFDQIRVEHMCPDCGHWLTAAEMGLKPMRAKEAKESKP